MNRARLILAGLWKMRLFLVVVAVVAAAVIMWVGEPGAAPIGSSFSLGNPGTVVALAIVFLFVAVILSSAKKASTPYACTRCHSVAPARMLNPGSLLTEILLFCLFVVPWIIYAIWRRQARKLVCSVCGADAIVPVTSPEGARIAASAQAATASR